jgi:hypothetical protein
LISTKIGFAPAATAELAVATNVNDGSKTSSFCFTPAASNAACNAAVPELTAITCFTLR